jgi:glycosyltransferase involved in cell wall biosynthesis
LRLRKLIQFLRPNLLHTWGNRAARIGHLSAYGVSLAARLATITEIPQPRSDRWGSIDRWWTAGVQLIAVHPSIAAALANLSPTNVFRVIPLAVEGETADRSESRRQLLGAVGLNDDNVVLVGSVADLEPRTRLKDLIWAADLLSCIRDDVHLILVGSGWQKSRLIKFLAPTGARVHFLAERDLEPRHLAGLDIYWQSHAIQPLPAAMMRAMALGVPVISVAGPGLNEIVRHQQTGMIVNVGARNEFASWTKFMVEHARLARQLGSQGRQHVLSEFGAKKIWSEYETLYCGTP